MSASALLLALLLALAAPARAADGLHVPSGQVILPYEALWEDFTETAGEGRSTRLVLRFLTPEIARDKGLRRYGDVEADFEYLCREIGLPLIEMTGGQVDQLVVTMLDAPLARGALDARVTQFNTVYRVDQGVCEWE